MCTVAPTAADKINGITRESISTVNKDPLTAGGNHLRLQFNSLPRNAQPPSSSSSRKKFIRRIKGRRPQTEFMKDLRPSFKRPLQRVQMSLPESTSLSHEQISGINFK